MKMGSAGLNNLILLDQVKGHCVLASSSLSLSSLHPSRRFAHLCPTLGVEKQMGIRSGILSTRIYNDATPSPLEDALLPQPLRRRHFPMGGMNVVWKDMPSLILFAPAY